MLDIKNIRYPDLEQIVKIYPTPNIILGKYIVWQEKLDGSNIGLYLDDSDGIQMRSRNMINASNDFYDIIFNSEERDKAKDLLISLKYDWHDESVIFGELLTKGKSPTRIETYNENKFVIFDIWSSRLNGFENYTLVHQHAYQFGIPIVELYGTSRHTTLESLYMFRDDMLDLAKKNGKEGVVGKIYENNVKFKYFKEKLDLPLLDKKSRKIDDGIPKLPPLPESEVFGSLDKVLVDIGKNKFKDKSIAMPMFAKYVRVECRKHFCGKPTKNLYSFYAEKLGDFEHEI